MSIRLLLADDQALVRGALAAREHHVDVAPLDVEVPGMDGFAATAALELVVEDTPVKALAHAVRDVRAGRRVVDPALAADSLVAGEPPLMQRGADVLRAARGGATVADLAAVLFLSSGTVLNHVSSAIGKTGSRARAEAVAVADGNSWP